nr:hypothetical protein [Tanacetum cinerariifolium]
MTSRKEQQVLLGQDLSKAARYCGIVWSSLTINRAAGVPGLLVFELWELLHQVLVMICKFGNGICSNMKTLIFRDCVLFPQ